MCSLPDLHLVDDRFVTNALTWIEMYTMSAIVENKSEKIKESDYTGAKFHYQMPFISSSELCSRI